MTLEPATDWQHQLPEAHDYEALDERDPHVSPAVSHCVGSQALKARRVSAVRRFSYVANHACSRAFGAAMSLASTRMVSAGNPCCRRV